MFELARARVMIVGVSMTFPSNRRLGGKLPVPILRMRILSRCTFRGPSASVTANSVGLLATNPPSMTSKSPWFRRRKVLFLEVGTRRTRRNNRFGDGATEAGDKARDGTMCLIDRSLEHAGTIVFDVGRNYPDVDKKVVEGFLAVDLLRVSTQLGCPCSRTAFPHHSRRERKVPVADGFCNVVAERNHGGNDGSSARAIDEFEGFM